MRLRSHRRHDSAAVAAYRQAGWPSRDTPWAQAPYAVVDLETTGLDPRSDEIVSFAALPIDDGRVVMAEASTFLIRPRTMPPASTIRIHGLRPADLDAAPPLSEALDRILDSLSGRVLVAHAAWVERGFLRAALKTGRLKLHEPVLDTAAIALRALRREDGHEGAIGLSDAARELGLPVHSPHIAAGDALTTAQLFLALANRLDRDEPQTVGSLARY